MVHQDRGCVRKGENDLTFEQCHGYIAHSPEDMQLILDKLKQCEVEEGSSLSSMIKLIP